MTTTVVVFLKSRTFFHTQTGTQSVATTHKARRHLQNLVLRLEDKSKRPDAMSSSPFSSSVTWTLRLLWFCATAETALAQQCTICKDGSAVPFPEKTLDFERIPVDNCGSLETTAGFLRLGTGFCNSIQAIGTLCGCSIPENACTLCRDGESVSNHSLELDGYLASSYILGPPDGVLMTCESMEAMHIGHVQEDSFCAATQ
eukprot:CAMPEP_0116853922 /NCGR_PEP_ID=MMETSP0418-20121206/18245_1 /TAXON_ID=1158023 /ORGANISM="Astrosyne radiata, Strain 13vi08-1A" /LENGTH=200 /DNA_ID=CAMNT_0004486505 /DNA_START=147 /DNA_END=750 /DNA_ORIENTATION=-